MEKRYEVTDEKENIAEYTRLTEKFNGLANMCKEGTALTAENVGNCFFRDNGTFQLVIPNEGNTPEHGEFFINSIKGHKYYSYSDASTHTYHVLNGNGVFIIDGENVPLTKGKRIDIFKGAVYTYVGNMLLVEEMTPNYVPEWEHEVEEVDYSTIDEIIGKPEGISK